MQRPPGLLALVVLAAGCSVKPVALTSTGGADASASDERPSVEAAVAPPDAEPLAADATTVDVATDAGAGADLSADSADAPISVPGLDLAADQRLPPDLLPDPTEPDPDAAAPLPDAAPDLALAPDAGPPPHGRELVFVANQDSNDISVFSVDAVTGDHTVVPGSPFATDERPFGLAITPDGKLLYACHYGSENVRGFRVAADGRLSALPSAPAPMPHPEALVMAVTGKALYARGVDGLLYGFSIDSGTGALHALADSPLSGVNGVQGLAADPLGRFLAVTTRDDPSGAGSVRLFSMDVAGALQPALRIAAPGLLQADSPALAFDPTGASLYGAMTVAGGGDRIFGLSVGPGPALSPIAGGPWPGSAEGHSLTFHPSRPLVYYASTTDVRVMTRAGDGSLTPVGAPVLFNNDTDATVSTAGSFLYVLFQSDDELIVSRVAESGLPEPFAGSPWKAGTNPWRLVVWAPPRL
jgi:6-phosphogluconolactonase (cycloisomerase 2 family)